jgi:hypothetical protein
MVGPKKAPLDHVSTVPHPYFLYRRLVVLTRPVCWFWFIVSASPGKLAPKTSRSSLSIPLQTGANGKP